jgi:hypothetical protein
MNTPTSLEAFAKLQPFISGRRLFALRVVLENPGKTALELERIANDRSLHKRLTELEALKLVHRGETRPCTASPSAARAVTWVVTAHLDDVYGAMAMKPKKKNTRAQLIELIAEADITLATRSMLPPASLDFLQAALHNAVMKEKAP